MGGRLLFDSATAIAIYRPQATFSDGMCDGKNFAQSLNDFMKQTTIWVRSRRPRYRKTTDVELDSEHSDVHRLDWS